MGIKIINGVVSSDHIHLVCVNPATLIGSGVCEGGEGTEFKKSAAGVSGVAQTLLGASLLGARLLQRHEWERNR